MTTANFVSALRSFARRMPFRPFWVELNSGQRIQVVHPEALSLRGDVIVFVSPRKRYRLFDAASVSQLFDPPEN